MPRIEGENGDPLAKFARELPAIVDEEGAGLMGEIIRRRSRDVVRFDGSSRLGIDELNLVIQTLPSESARFLAGALWRVVEATYRQGVLPSIVEIDRFGRPVERSQN